MAIKIKSTKSQKGQALIILLLIMAAVLTVTLSAASRSITEIAISTTEEDSLRAFSAAEAGIEEKLLNPLLGDYPAVALDSSSSYDADVTANIESDSQFKYPRELASGETATFWFVSHDPTGRLNCAGQTCTRVAQMEFCWGKEPEPDSGVRPAIEVMLFYDSVNPSQSVADPNNFANVKIARFAYDRYAGANQNNFDNSVNRGGCSIDGTDFLYRKRQNIAFLGGIECQTYAGCYLMATVRMLYNDNGITHPVGIKVQGGSEQRLPAQGILIESLGTAGQSTRRVNVFQGYPETPNLFETAVFSNSGLSK